MKNIGYVIKLSGKPDCYAYGRTLHSARVFSTREAARENKRIYTKYGMLEEIWQVELTSTGKAKTRVRKVR